MLLPTTSTSLSGTLYALTLLSFVFLHAVLNKKGRIFAFIGCLALTAVSIPPASSYAQIITQQQEISRLAGSIAEGFENELRSDDAFGYSIANLGDLNGDGTNDLAVGAPLDDDGGNADGAVWIMFMRPDGTARDWQKISNSSEEIAGVLEFGGQFGYAVSALGDMDNDGVTELAVGARIDAAVWILFLRNDGTVKRYQKLDSEEGGITGLPEFGSQFGYALSALDDLDGDGVPELAVGDPLAEGGGALWILFLNADGTVKEQQLISATAGNFSGNLGPFDLFGSSVSTIGDFDGDGVQDLAVGAVVDNESRGALWLLFLQENGTVKGHQEISSTAGGLEGLLEPGDRLGSSVHTMGDFNGDGVTDLAVGVLGDKTNRTFASFDGLIWFLFLNPDGSVKDITLLGDWENETLITAFDLGHAIHFVDIDGNGLTELVAGTPGGNSFWILNLYSDGDIRSGQEISATTGTQRDSELQLSELSSFGYTLSDIGDLDGDGVSDLIAASAEYNSELGEYEQAIWVLFMTPEGMYKNIQHISSPDTDEPIPATSITNLGDLDEDGVPELAVGSLRFEEDGNFVHIFGSVQIVYLNRDGTVKDIQEISEHEDGFTSPQEDYGHFGTSVSSLGDIDGDTVPDLAVGSPFGDDAGVVWILFLNRDGTVKDARRISYSENGLEGDRDSFLRFGESVSALNDLDGDGINELAVGSAWDEEIGFSTGAVWILFLNAEGGVKNAQKIGPDQNGFLAELERDADFGRVVYAGTDLNGDDVSDLLVSAQREFDGSTRDILWILFLNADGTVRDYQRISEMEGGFDGTISDGFGGAMTSPGDLDGDGAPDLAIYGRIPNPVSSNPLFMDVVWILFLNLPPEISSINSTSVPLAGTGEDYQVVSLISDVSAISNVEINLRRSGDLNVQFSAQPMIGGPASGEFTATIPDGLLTERGIEYFITATDEFGLQSRFPRNGFRSLPVAVPALTSPFTVSGGVYRLFSIPLQVDDADVASILSDDLGAYDNTEWRFFEPEPGLQPGDFKEYPNTAPFAPGKAFWLIDTGTGRFVNSGPARSLATDTIYELPLKPGWNYIGNPFAFNIPFSNLSLTSGQVLNAFRYAGFNWVDATGATFEPYEGYALLSPAGDDVLRIVPFIGNPGGVPGKSAASNSFNWHVDITATTGFLQDDNNTIATGKQSATGWDPLDSFEPPLQPGDYLSLYFPHEDWGKIPGRYSRDIRPEPGNGDVWEVELISSQRAPVEISFDGVQDVPDHYEVWLVDDLLQQSQNLREAPTYTVAGPIITEPRSLKVIIGDPSFSSKEIETVNQIPDEYDLKPNFPNPFIASTTIPYSLPQAEHVTIEIYDILGKKIATVLDGQDQSAGHHAAIWDGLNDANQTVASGVYFIAFRAGTFTKTSRTVLVR